MKKNLFLLLLTIFAFELPAIGQQFITTIAGTGAGGYSGDGLPATAKEIYGPAQLFVDGLGNIFIADALNNRIRKISTSGIITTVAGNGTAGYVSDGVAATTTELNTPSGVIVDDSGNIFISDTYNQRVRKVNTSGIISTIAGTGTAGFSGDGGAATSAKFDRPYGLAFDSYHNLYIVDQLNHEVRELINATGIISRFAGTGTAGYSGDGGPADSALIHKPNYVITDASNNVYITDNQNQVIRKVNTSGIITTIAGTAGSIGYGGDGGPATAAIFAYPAGIRLDASGNLYICDYANNRIRMVNSATGIINTVVGTGTGGYNGDGIAATSAEINNPIDVEFTSSGNLIIADYLNNRIRELYPNHAPKFTGGERQTITVCENSYDTLNSHLSVLDSDAGQTEIWTLLSAPMHGTLNNGATLTAGGFVFSTASTGVTLTIPVADTGVFYQPTSGFTGVDSFSFVISDGIAKDTTWIIVTVAPTPAITGIFIICAGSTTVLGDIITGGTWTSANTSSATVSLSAGLVTGVAAGTATIRYSVLAGCGLAVSTTLLTVNPAPSVITGMMGVCPGETTALSDSVTGGTWSSATTTVASVNATTGLVTGGASAGSTTITYALADGCTPATATVTVYPPPTPIIGAGVICTGTTQVLSDATTGGTWSSSSASVATIGSTSGIVTGGALSSAGTATITYTSPGGCFVSKVVTVDPQPAPITGASSVCTGATASLFDGGGGSWSSSNTAIASAGTSGVVGGVAGGTATITYSLAPGCNATIAFTVIPSPSAITGATSLCTGTTTTLVDTTLGGFWTSSNATVAAIDPLSGVVSAGFGTGSSTISYTTGSGCATTTSVTVNVGPLPISGSFSICGTASTSLGDAIGSGSWNSGNTGVATVDGSGAVYGVSDGTTTISYSVGSCVVTAIVTVNPVPGLISGVSEECVGLASLLTDGTTGGTWSSSNTNVTIVPTSGILTGAHAGVATISYTLPGGCFVTSSVTVNTSPPAITGTAYTCPGSSTTLADAGGGSWSSSTTAVATVGPTGIVGGITSGTTTIIYSIGAGCSTSTTVTVNALPPAIGGTETICSGSSTTLSDGAGTWSSGNTTVATAGSTTGAITGAAPGTATITYTAAATGCTAHATVTVNPLPYAITGTFSLCPEATTVLGDLTSGGAWSSSSTTIASISATGTVTGLTGGTTVITYTAPVTGCSRTQVVTVNQLPALPGVPAGSMSICSEATTLLTDATSGGLWSTAPGGAVTVTTTGGLVSGVSAGTAIVSYTLATGCARATTLTVNALPTITGPTAECVGAVIPETASLTGGSWSSSVLTVATVNSSGGVTGVATGTTVITYSSAAGCKATTIVTVSLSPTAITGIPIAIGICANDTTTLGDAVGGGAWSSDNTAAATIGSLTGTVTGVAAGTTIITYSLGTGCTVTKILSVNPAPLPIAIGSSGGMAMCVGNTTALADGTTGGTWSSNATGIATVIPIAIGTGTVTGGTPGTATISYVVSATGCAASAIVTVNLTPTAITGTASVCAGNSTTLSDAVTGGAWTSSNTSVASVIPIAIGSGNITGGIAGTATITYSLGAGCAVTRIVTVNPISAITGSTGICLGATTALADGTGGGIWSSSAGSTAPVSPAGVVSGALAGTATITYTTAAGCTATAVITVNLAPSAISGTLHVCAGGTTILGNTAGGGTWTSGNTVTATINTTGTVTGSAPGTSVITYSLGSGCTVTATVTVNSGAAGIMGATSLCSGNTITLSDATTGGVWSSTPTSVATISGAGVVTGGTEGIASILYTPVTGCASVTTITVNPAPEPITGVGHVCAGLTTTLGSTPTDGAWTSSNTAVATADPTSGIITGVIPGTSAITYTLPAGCSITTTVTINSAPAGITGGLAMCTGSATTLADPSGSGIWSSSNTAIATISGTGVVTGEVVGTSTISYAVGGCPATTVVTVNSLPDALSGATICVGATATLTDLPGGGTWSSSNNTVASISETAGVVTGATAGLTTIAYSLGAGCTVTATVVVDGLPGSIAGTSQVCLGYTTILSDGAGGGVWSSSNTGIAVVSSSGAVNGVTGGPATISYTSTSTGCAATRLVTVVAVPAIMGVSDMCAYSETMTVSDSIPGGTWTSISATVSTAGVVTPYASGPAIVTYTIPLGCYTTTAFTVHPLPGPVVGDFHFCRGLTTSLSDTTLGGTWSSSNSAVAPIGPTGEVSGLSAGTAVISYTMPTGCMETQEVIIDSTPAAGTITGLGVVCVGSTIDLSDPSAGGVWSSSSSSATVSDGVVSGMSAGSATISYTVTNACGTARATAAITINPLPGSGTISGLGSVCVGASVTLTDAVTDGLWSSSNSDATVSTGITTGVAAGTDTIAYTVTNSCGTAVATKAVIINTLPAVPGPISGIDTLCMGFTYTLTDGVTGGSWTSSNGVVSVTAGGLISALSAGVDTITYSLTNMCGTVAVTTNVAIKAMGAPDTISGPAYVCEGANDTLSVTTPGGIWSSLHGDVTVAATTTGAIITGVTAGVDTMVYAIGSECGPGVAMYPVTVLSLSQCDSTTGTVVVSKNAEHLQVWPNPNDGAFMLRLSSSADETVEITITNIVGEKVKELTTVTNKSTAILLNDAAGVYFISASTKEGAFVAKVAVGN